MRTVRSAALVLSRLGWAPNEVLHVPRPCLLSIRDGREAVASAREHPG